MPSSEWMITTADSCGSGSSKISHAQGIAKKNFRSMRVSYLRREGGYSISYVLLVEQFTSELIVQWILLKFNQIGQVRSTRNIYNTMCHIQSTPLGHFHECAAFRQDKGVSEKISAIPFPT